MGSADQSDVEDFYLAAYPRLVAALMLTTSDRADAEDAAQEAFTRLLRSGRWGSISAPEAWLYIVALNVLRRRWRQGARARERARLLAFSESSAPSSALSTDRLDVERALRGIPARYRAPVVMFYVFDMSIAQIAESCGLKVGTVKSQLSRGRQLLAAHLTEVTIP